MDARQRLALEDAIRGVVGRDLDRLTVEVEALNEQLATVSRLLGLGRPLAVRERRQRAAAMRQEGLSTRAIAQALGSHRNTIVSDLRRLGIEPPGGRVLGLDGRQTAPRLSPPR